MSKGRNRGTDITKEIFADHGGRGPKYGSSDQRSKDGSADGGQDYRQRRDDGRGPKYGYKEGSADGGQDYRRRRDDDRDRYPDRRNDGFDRRNDGFDGRNGRFDRRSNHDESSRRYDNRHDSDGWTRGSDFEKYSKEVDEAQEHESSNIKFFDRGLSRDEIKLRTYIYNYLKANIEQQIKENQETGNSTNKLIFNIKEDDIIKDVFNGDDRANVYDMLNRKRESHRDGRSGIQLFNPIASSVFKALNGFEPDIDMSSQPKRVMYSGLTIKNVSIEVSHFSKYVWSVVVIMRDEKPERRNNGSRDRNQNRERVWQRSTKESSPSAKQIEKPTEPMLDTEPTDV